MKNKTKGAIEITSGQEMCNLAEDCESCQ